jgi:hypothetical protein
MIDESGIQLEDGYLRLTLAGESSFARSIDRVDAAIRDTIRTENSRLLVDIRQITGVAPPTTVERYGMMEKWASSAAGRVRVALIAPAELIDHEKIGVTIARNRAFDADVFLDEPSALAWLLR